MDMSEAVVRTNTGNYVYTSARHIILLLMIAQTGILHSEKRNNLRRRDVKKKKKKAPVKSHINIGFQHHA